MAGLDKLFGGGATDTLLGLPKARLDGLAADIAVFGADCATPYASVGAYCAGGPEAMRRGAGVYSGSHQRYNFDLGHAVLPDGVVAVDLGDLPVRDDQAASNRTHIADVTRRIVQAGAVPVLLGGDDSVPIPMLEGLEALGPLWILQIDAHIDWRDEAEGTRWGLSSTMRRASEMPHVRGIVQVGARGVGSATQTEVTAAEAYGAHLITTEDCLDDGLARAAALIPQGAQVVICFDCDALDPAIMPAVIAPTAGGLSYMQVLRLLKDVAGHARIAGFDLVEFKPDADLHGIGARTAGQLLTSVLGLIGAQCAAGNS